MIKSLACAFAIALFVLALCFAAAYLGWFSECKTFMDSIEFFGFLSAFFGFPVLVAGLWKFTRGLIPIEDLKRYENRFKKKISGEISVTETINGQPIRQGGELEFKVFFTTNPDGVLQEYYSDPQLSWPATNYICVKIKGANKAAIRRKFDPDRDDFWIVCASQKQRFVRNPKNKVSDPKTLGQIQFTDAEKEIMRLISRHSI